MCVYILCTYMNVTIITGIIIIICITIITITICYEYSHEACTCRVACITHYTTGCVCSRLAVRSCSVCVCVCVCVCLCVCVRMSTLLSHYCSE